MVKGVVVPSVFYIKILIYFDKTDKKIGCTVKVIYQLEYRTQRLESKNIHNFNTSSY